MTAGEAITVRRYEASQAEEWRQFIGTSGNGTLFHHLDFLDYHRAGRFETHHLMFYRGDTLIAVMPAAIVEDSGGRSVLQSPYGASVGGPVIEDGMGIAAVLEIVAILHAYAEATGMHAIELRVGPNSYLREPNDMLPFALMVSGFQIIHRWLTFMVRLSPDVNNPAERLFSQRQRGYVRAGLNKGLRPREVSCDRLDDFYSLVEDTYARHGSQPTHEKKELENLFRLVPGKARLFLCAYEQTEVAGFLVFILNAQVAYSFYICQSAAHRELRGTVVLFSHVMAKLAGEGFRYLDMGPSVSDTHFNTGVCAFKESLGAQGFCRETWRLDCLSPALQA